MRNAKMLPTDDKKNALIVSGDKEEKAVYIQAANMVTLKYNSVDGIMALFHAVISCAVEVWPDDPLMREWQLRNQTGHLDPPEV